MTKEELIQFRDKLVLIPDAYVLPSIYTNGINACCVLGHLQRLNSADPKDYSDHNCWEWKDDPLSLRNLSVAYFIAKGMKIKVRDITGVNNIKTDQYPQETPKQRSLALINDMVEWLETKETSKQNERED